MFNNIFIPDYLRQAYTNFLYYYNNYLVKERNYFYYFIFRMYFRKEVVLKLFFFLTQSELTWFIYLPRAIISNSRQPKRSIDVLERFYA